MSHATCTTQGAQIRQNYDSSKVETDLAKLSTLNSCHLYTHAAGVPCRIEEWAGGFDGFWHTKAADTQHEPGIKEAVRQLLGVSYSTAGNECVSFTLC